MKHPLLTLRLHPHNLRRQLLLRLARIIPHHRECQDLLNRVVIGEEHDETIDTAAPAPRGREPVLQTLAERLVDELGLFVTGFLLPGLLFEAEALVERVV